MTASAVENSHPSNADRPAADDAGTLGSRLTDVELVRLLLNHAGPLRTFVELKIPARLRGTLHSEDVLQEVWVTAFRQIAGIRYQGPSMFYNWLKTLADRKLIDSIKSATSQRRGGPEQRFRRLDLNVASWVQYVDVLAAP